MKHITVAGARILAIPVVADEIPSGSELVIAFAQSHDNNLEIYYAVRLMRTGIQTIAWNRDTHIYGI